MARAGEEMERAAGTDDDRSITSRCSTAPAKTEMHTEQAGQADPWLLSCSCAQEGRSSAAWRAENGLAARQPGPWVCGITASTACSTAVAARTRVTVLARSCRGPDDGCCMTQECNRKDGSVDSCSERLPSPHFSPGLVARAARCMQVLVFRRGDARRQSSALLSTAPR